jgi:hypothetical protein
MWYSCFFLFIFFFELPDPTFVPERVLPVSLPKLKLACTSPPLREGLKLNFGGFRLPPVAAQAGMPPARSLRAKQK